MNVDRTAWRTVSVHEYEDVHEYEYEYVETG
jgi:hypothetical protein